MLVMHMEIRQKDMFGVRFHTIVGDLRLSVVWLRLTVVVCFLWRRPTQWQVVWQVQD